MPRAVGPRSVTDPVSAILKPHLPRSADARHEGLMTFRFIAPDMIRSASQRALLNDWDRLAAGRPFPAFAELRPDPALHDPRQLVAWAVEGEGRLRKFRAMYQGEHVA